MHRRAAPLARERLPVRRHHPAGQHHARSRGHRHQHPAGSALPDACCIQEQAIEPVGESKSDYEIVVEIAEEAGHGGPVHRGQEHLRTSQKEVFDDMEGGQVHELGGVQGEEVPASSRPLRTGRRTPSGIPPFYEDPDKHPLETPTGKLEFYSERLAKHFPDDKERPPIPKWIESSETHDERLSSERADMFPLLLMSNHGRVAHARPGRRHHLDARDPRPARCWASTATSTSPCWINPKDAAARGIKDGDIVKIFNERGIVLGGARVWERIMPGVVYIDHGARHDPSVPARSTAAAPSTPSPRTASPPRTRAARPPAATWSMSRRFTAKSGSKWRSDYPEAFAREYDPARRPALRRLDRRRR